ncbi:HEXXH motif-containing putative peptide modification protein [Lentzea sp. NBC_00516]|uniref:aKG-HExxH-type peptide beta-hydroxylase n=1 Tax=Lentzea sp. NBC_00516 TaxID=2903582 RepID=UPI002E81097A|nr:HEXXH motif-containing putative peptide modification protein [Lentzea sp. NBC_00516]WUD27547.1 HEXXH motif-containing putative peptide modification protein [Lentzea sp. NBC_00516]
MGSTSELQRLRVPLHVFDQICAGPVDDESMALLRRGQYSIRLLRLRTLLESMRGRGSWSDDGEQAWIVLADAGNAAPAVVEDLLMHPAVGVWLARTLHDVCGAPPEPAEIVELHAIAAAAAVRSGLTGSLYVPVVDGTVALPTVGQWRLADHVDRVELRFDSGEVAVGSGASFVKAKRHHAKASGRSLEVAFDDVDRHREFAAPAAPNPLDPAAFDAWCGQLDQAWDLLTRWHTGYAGELAAGLTTLIPLEAGTSVFAASSTNAFGGVALSPKDSATDLAEAIVHEVQHSKLNALMDLLPLHQEDHTWFYAPWRDDPRSLGGLLHGIYAFTSVVEFWHVQRDLVSPAESRRGQFTFAYRCRQIRQAVDAVGDAGQLTDLGRRFVAAASARLAALDPAGVPADLTDAITTLLADHQATWRIHHVQPDAGDVSEVADAWTDARPSPRTVRGEVVPGPQAAESPRTALVRRRALGSESCHGESAHALFARGDHEAAAGAYERLVQADPRDRDAWVGLGLATGAPALLSQPATVQAVHLRLLARDGTAPAPRDLAAWLSPA